MQPEPLETVGDLVHHLREHWGGQRELLRTSTEGSSRTLSSKELIADTHALALSLEALGARPGSRLALLSHNRPGWLVVDLACHLLGVITVPVDPRMTADQIGFILRNSRPAFLVYGGSRERGLLERSIASLQPTPTLISIDGGSPAPGGHALTPLVGLGAERLLQTPLSTFSGRIDPGAPATLTYTSGATGDPKGVLLSHRNLLSVVTFLGRRLDFRARDRALSLLPWAHPLERLAVYAYLDHGVSIVSPPTGIDPLLAIEREQPTHFVLPPSLLDRLRAEIYEDVGRAGPLTRRRFRWAVRRALPAEGEDRLPRAPLARRFLGPVRRALGGRARILVGGFSPIAPSTEALFRASGIDLCLGYGLVESTGWVTATEPKQRTLGTVGKALPGNRLKIERDGEILVSGPGVHLRYWHEEPTAPTLETGPFPTGDLGRLDLNGCLHLRARRSSRIQLASGEWVAPHPLELRLQESESIDRAIVVGHGRTEVGALIVPANPPSMSPETPVEARILPEIQRINQDLPEAERIRRFHLLPRPLSVETGELTRNGQLRRRAILDRWAEEIEALWNAEEDPSGVRVDGSGSAKAISS